MQGCHALRNIPNPFGSYVKKHFANGGGFASSKWMWPKNLVNSGRYDGRVLALDKPTYLDNYLQVQSINSTVLYTILTTTSRYSLLIVPYYTLY
jgi:hypothetical protein